MIKQFAEKLIRKRVTDGLFDVSLHAMQRMAERQTVCRTRDEVWEYIEKVLKRRERHTK